MRTGRKRGRGRESMMKVGSVFEGGGDRDEEVIGIEGDG